MRSYHLILGSASLDHMLHTIANGHDHVVKSLDFRAIRYLPSRRHDTESIAGPSVERFH
jgi:hypothetical protein